MFFEVELAGLSNGDEEIGTKKGGRNNVIELSTHPDQNTATEPSSRTCMKVLISTELLVHA